jgi:alkylation response protein AidB-like acyl-CoA dehydrogenase
VPISPTEEQEALRDAIARLLDKASSPEHVRGAAPLGFSPDLWAELSTLGLVPAAASGDAGLVDLALVAEECGAHLAPVPFVEAAVAARLLGRDEGERLVTFAPRPAEGGVARLVPGAAVADAVVGLDGDRLVLVATPGRQEPPANLAGEPLADVDLSEGEELARGPEAVARYERAVDEWRALTACALVGLAGTALELGRDYARDREQFGVPIASFQAIGHRLADAHTAVAGSRLLAYEAAAACDQGASDGAVLASMSFLQAGEVAEETAQTSLHVHGGYGFMLEYDIQLHVRQAKAWRTRLGDPRAQLVELAGRLWPADGDGGTALRRVLDPATEAFRAEVRAFIAEHLTDEITDRVRETGTLHDWGMHRALCDAGYLAAGWPTEVGGGGRSAIETTALIQEFYYAGAPVDGALISAMVGATLLLRGTDEQRSTVLPGILGGEVMCCLGYSEPDAGSDVAAVQTRAVRDGDEWVINGQKMFTTMAHESQYVFLLTRTDPDKPKHRGLTMFLVPMDTPGVEITPMETFGGERTNVTFYTDVRVHDRFRVGDVDDGWSVMHAALVYERGSANWGEPARVVDATARWAHEQGRLGDPLLAERLALHASRLEVGRLLLYRTAELAAEGGLPLVEGSMAKLYITEAFTRAVVDLTDALGIDAVLAHGAPGAPLGGLLEHAYRHATVTTIYGGSSEIQRGIIAQHGLGLPRGRT